MKATGFRHARLQRGVRPSTRKLSIDEVQPGHSLFCLGMTGAQVTEQFVISPHTVNWHLTSSYSKLGVSSRSAAAHFAVEHHLV